MLFIREIIEENLKGFFRKRITFKLGVPKNIPVASDQLIFEYTIDDVDAIGDAAIFSLFPIAYWENFDIGVADNIKLSETLFENADRICKEWNKRYGFERDIKIQGGCAVNIKNHSSGKKCGLLFSGGVDSSATFVDKEAEIDYLMFCYGADIVNNLEKFEELKAAVLKVSSDLGKDTIFYSTNIRCLTGISWGHILHGAALIAPTLAMPNVLKKVIISASNFEDIAYNIPRASSPAFDHFITNGYTQIEHYGTHLNRLDKIKKIEGNSVLLNHLHVCYDNTSDYNCGRCEKCLRTMIVFLLLGKSSQDICFPSENYSFQKIFSILKHRSRIGPTAKLHWSEALLAVQKDEFKMSISERNFVEQQLKSLLGSFLPRYLNRKNDPYFYDQFIGIRKQHRLERFLKLPIGTFDFIRKIKTRIMP